MMKYTSENRYCGLRKLVLFLFCLMFFINGWGQGRLTMEKDKDLPPPRNLKILEEHKDAKGNIVRTIQYDQGKNRITETLIIPPKSNINIRIPINPDTLNKDS